MTNKTRSLAVLLAAGAPLSVLTVPAALAQSSDQAPQPAGPQGRAASAGERLAEAGEQTTGNAGAASSNALQEVVVTGIRHSMASALKVKKDTMEIVDSISAEDIGKLPDNNVADTLTRVPGVQAYRYGGEAASPVGQGSGLTIRGLTGQTALRLDGREYFTAGGREFNVEDAIPGLVSGIDVYKNPDAAHVEGGIGGLVNIRTRMPLDFAGLTVSTAAYEHYNDLSRKAEPEVFGLISNRWRVGGGDMGLLFAGDYQEGFDRSDSDPDTLGPNTRLPVNAASPQYATLAGANQAYAGQSNVWYLDSNPADIAAANPQSLITTLGAQRNIFAEDIHRVRKGADFAYQWRPNDQLELYAQANYNYYLYDQRYRFAFLNDSPYVQNLVTQPYAFTSGFYNRNAGGGGNQIISGQRFVSGTFLNSSVSDLMGGSNHRPYITWLTAIGAKWYPTDSLDVHFDMPFIKAHQTNDNRDVRAVPVNGLTWNITRNLATSPDSLSISGPSLSDPANFVYQAYDDNTNEVYSDDGYAPKLDVKYKLRTPLLTAVESGARYSVHNSLYTNYVFGNVPLTTNGQPLAANQSNAISLASSPGILSLSPTNWFAGQQGYSGGYVVYNPLALWEDGVRRNFPSSNIPAGNDLPENLLAHHSSTEKTYAIYVMGDFAWRKRIKGNIGVRAVKTDLHAQSMVQSYLSSGQKGAIVPNSQTSSYTDVLPSFNITGYLTPDTLLRFGYSKGLTRQDLSQLVPTTSINISNGTGTAGNTQLKPYRADSYDISLEKYFSRVGYVSFDVYYKAIHGFIFGEPQCVTVPFAPAPVTSPCGNGQYEITVSQNAQDGSVKGMEFAFQTFFDFLPGIFKSFGAAGSYAYVQTKNPVQFTSGGPVVDVPMPFQSKNSYSVSGLFEHGPVSGRLIYTYRSDFVLFGVNAFPSFGRYVKGYGMLDAALNIGLPVQGLDLSLNASNLTNVGASRFVGEPGGYASDFSNQFFLNGRNYSVGLRYTFRQ